MILQTPGVYVNEISGLPDSVPGISTAVPVFIGFTHQVQTDVVRISSLPDFTRTFGADYQPVFRQFFNAGVPTVIPDRRFFLYESIRMYFRNGGGPCYIVSAGTFDELSVSLQSATVRDRFITALSKVALLDEVNLIAIPDLHLQYDAGAPTSEPAKLDEPHFFEVVNAALSECGDLKNKFLLIDFQHTEMTAAEFRNGVNPGSSDHLKYGAAYYPWLRQSEKTQVGFESIDTPASTGSPQETAFLNIRTDLANLAGNFSGMQTVSSLKKQFSERASLVNDNNSKTNFTNALRYLLELVSALSHLSLTDQVLVQRIQQIQTDDLIKHSIKGLYRMKALAEAENHTLTSTNWPVPADILWLKEVNDNYTTVADFENDPTVLTGYVVTNVAADRITILNNLESGNPVNLQPVFSAIAGLCELATYRLHILEQQLFAEDRVYAAFRAAVSGYMQEIPSSGAIAGIYCTNDRERGVWKSPANLTVQGIEKPVREVTNAEQDGLNVDPDYGKSINVIRTFTGKGPLVWGARTLAGNSNEWRYVSVRRFFNSTEESIRKSLQRLVFEPNNARTWVRIKAMITGLLVEQWKAGALNGSTMDQAFFVKVGEDTTTPAEILDGKIIIQIGLAAVRPAEFILLEFSHQSR